MRQWCIARVLGLCLCVVPPPTTSLPPQKRIYSLSLPHSCLVTSVNPHPWKEAGHKQKEGQSLSYREDPQAFVRVCTDHRNTLVLEKSYVIRWWINSTVIGERERDHKRKEKTFFLILDKRPWNFILYCSCKLNGSPCHFIWMIMILKKKKKGRDKKKRGRQKECFY